MPSAVIIGEAVLVYSKPARHSVEKLFSLARKRRRIVLLSAKRFTRKNYKKWRFMVNTSSYTLYGSPMPRLGA